MRQTIERVPLSPFDGVGLSREALANTVLVANLHRRRGRRIAADGSYGDAAFVLSADVGLCSTDEQHHRLARHAL